MPFSMLTNNCEHKAARRIARRPRTLKTLKTEKVGNSNIPVASIKKLIKTEHYKIVETKTHSDPNSTILNIQSGLVNVCYMPLNLQIGGQANERDGTQIKSLMTMGKFTIKNPLTDKGVWARLLVLLSRANVEPTDLNMLQDEDLLPTALTGLIHDMTMQHNNSDFIKLRDKVYFLSPNEQGASSHYSTKYITTKVKRRVVYKYPDTIAQVEQSPVANPIWYCWFTSVEVGQALPQGANMLISANTYHFYKDK